METFPNHHKWNVRTGLVGEEDHVQVPGENFRVRTDWNDDVEQTEPIIRERQMIIASTKSTVHEFHITQLTYRDMEPLQRAQDASFHLAGCPTIVVTPQHAEGAYCD